MLFIGLYVMKQNVIYKCLCVCVCVCAQVHEYVYMCVCTHMC